MNTNYRFNRNQLLSLCSVMLLAPALRLFPSGATALAGRAVWLSAPASIPFLLIYIYFLSRFMDMRRENEGMAELALRSFGNKAGRIVLAVIAVWLLLYSGFVLRSGADRLITTVYPYSTPHIFTITMGIISMIAALGSARSLVRVAKIVQPIVFGVLLLILVFAMFSVDFSNLMPITAYDAVPILKGTLPVIDVISVIIFLACFFTGFTPKESHRFRDYSIWMIAISLLLMLLSIAVVGSFGAELTARLTRPFFSLVRNLVFFHTLERVEALVVALWVFPDFLLVSLLLYSAQHTLRLVIGVKEPNYHGEKLFDMSGKRWVIIVCSAVSILCGLFIAPDPVSLDMWSEELIPLINLAVSLLFFPLIYIVGKARKKLWS